MEVFVLIEGTRRDRKEHPGFCYEEEFTLGKLNHIPLKGETISIDCDAESCDLQMFVVTQRFFYVADPHHQADREAEGHTETLCFPQVTLYLAFHDSEWLKGGE